METSVQKFDINQQMAIASKIDSVVSNVIKHKTAQGFELAFIKANAIEQISELLTSDVMKPIMALQGKKIGFKTDAIYKLDVVKECVIEATLNGLQVTGNQFNIIGGNAYTTQEGFTYLLSLIQDLWTDFIFDVPRITDKKAIIDVEVQWRIGEGNPIQSRKMTFSVKYHEKFTSDDAIVGKAERKAKKWLYYKITGNYISDGDEGSMAPTQDADYKIVEDDRIEKEEIIEDATIIEEELEPQELTEEMQRALKYLDAAVTNKDELKKRMDIVKGKIPTLNIKKYQEIFDNLKK